MLVPRPTSLVDTKGVIQYSVAIEVPQLPGKVPGDNTHCKIATKANSENLTGAIRAHYTWAFVTLEG